VTLVIAVANRKGGVAKTTTALSLGAALVEGRQQVLLVDLDPQANLTLALGVNPAGLDRTLADVLLGTAPLNDLTRETSLPGLDLAPANQDLLMAERFLAVRDNYEFILEQALAELPGYDVILLDCPPALGPSVQAALTAASLLIIPTQCEYFSAHALRDVLQLIRDIRTRTNPRLRYRLLLTMLDRRNRIHRSLYDQIRLAFGKAVFDTEIESDTRLRESPVLGQPITVYAPGSRAAEQYRRLAQELKDYVQETIGSSPQTA
jgi:chromosome partitioning protein